LKVLTKASNKNIPNIYQIFYIHQIKNFVYQALLKYIKIFKFGYRYTPVGNTEVNDDEHSSYGVGSWLLLRVTCGTKTPASIFQIT